MPGNEMGFYGTAGIATKYAMPFAHRTFSISHFPLAIYNFPFAKGHSPPATHFNVIIACDRNTFPAYFLGQNFNKN